MRLSIEPFDTYYNRRLLRWTGHVPRMPLTRAPRKILTSWVDNPRPLGCPQMNWGRTLKRPFWVMTFQLSSSNGARWQLIETNGLLFAVLKHRVLQKRHRPPPDKTSGHNFDTAMYPHEYKNLQGKPRWAGKMSREREKKYIQSDQPAWKSGGASATPKSRKNPVFDCAVALCTMQNALLVISNLTWLDDNALILKVEFFNFGHRCLHFSCSTDLNQRRENTFDRLLANKPDLDRPSPIFVNNRISLKKPVWATSCATQRGTESVRWAAGRR
jgi:hypothetical protein